MFSFSCQRGQLVRRSRRGGAARATRRFRPILEALEAYVLPSTFTVSTTADSGANSLRQAILNANTSGTASVVSFQFGVGGLHTFNLASALPPITVPITLDATTITGYSGTPLVELNGAATGVASSGIILAGGSTGSVVKGFDIHNFSGNGIDLAGTNNDVIQANFLGTDPTGTVAMPNGLDGIFIYFAATNNEVGGSTAAQRNIIAGNTSDGVGIYGAGTNNNIVTGNFIGTDVTGTKALGNLGYGVHVYNGPKGNQIGGASAALGNLIEFSTLGGVAVADLTSTGNSIRLNSIANNFGPGIDLGADGISLNHLSNSVAGPNNRQNYPQLVTATPGATTSVTGTLIAAPNTTIALDFFANAQPNPTYFGEGQRYLGSANLTTNASGNANFTVSLPAATAAGEWLSATATDPNGNTSEFSAALQLPGAPVAITPGTWTPLGPTPLAPSPDPNGSVISGRVDAVAADPTNPNTVYLATDRGGIWKTTDWQDLVPNWTPLTDNLSSTSFAPNAFQVLAIAPSDHNTIYAAASGIGGGILKSTNGGGSWTVLANAQFNTASFGALVVSSTNANILYAAVRSGGVGIAPAPGGGGIWKSTDGGATWANTTAAIAPATVASDLVIDPTNPNVLYAGLSQAGAASGVYRTGNGGVSWALLSSGILNGGAVGANSIRLALAPSAPATVYVTLFDPTLKDPNGSATGLPRRYVTTNSGNLFTPLAALPGTDEGRGTQMLLAVDPNNSQVVYANGFGNVFRSADAGKTWSLVANDDGVNGAFDDTGAFVLASNHGVYRVAAPGTRPLPKQGNLDITQVQTLTLDPVNRSIVYGVAINNLRGLKDTGGPAWNSLGDGNQSGRVLVDPVNPNRVYVFDPFNGSGVGFIRRSDDGGSTWVPKGVGIPTITAATPPVAIAGQALASVSQNNFTIDPSNPNRLLLGTTRVYVSNNNGDSWSDPAAADLSSGSFITALAVAPSAANTFYAGTADGKFWVSTNGGVVWTEEDTNLPAALYVTSIQIDPKDSKHLFVTVGASPNNDFNSAAIYTAPDAGVTWTSVTGNLAGTLPTLALAVDWRFAKPLLYVGTSRGVYSSPDAMTYTKIAGLPNTVVTDLQLAPQFDRLAVATYGRGVFESIIPEPTTHYNVTAVPTTTTAGVAVNVTVTALDSTNTAVGNYAGTIHFTSSDQQAGLPADYTFTAADNGSRTFKVTLKTTGMQTITASSTAYSGITGSTTVTVNTAAFGKFVVSGFPSPTTAGVAGGFTVTATDPFGNPTPGYTGTITFSSSDTKATLPPSYTFVAADNGMQSFSATLRTAGSESISVQDTGGFTGIQAGIMVVSAVPTSLAVTGFPSPATAGVAANFTVTARDTFGNTATSYTGTVSFTSSDGQAVLPAGYTFVAADNGAHTFSATLKTVGIQSITAKDTVNNFTASQTGITVNPGSTASSLVVAGFPTPTTAGVAGNFTVTARDAFGNTVTGYTGSVTFTSSDGQAVLPGGYNFVLADKGVHTFSATLKTAGSQSLTATDSVGGIAGSQTSIIVRSAAATSLAVAGFPSSVTAGVAANFTVTAKDAFGNTATGYTGIDHFTSSDPLAALPGDYTFTVADAGVHTFSATLKTNGTQSLTAKDTTSGIMGTEAGITVSAGPASLVLSGFPTSATAGVAANFTVAAKDIFGNTISGYTGTVTFTSSDPRAVLPANYTFTVADNGVHTFSATLKTAGTQSLTARDNAAGLLGSEAGITVNAAATSKFLVAGFPSPATAGVAGNFTVTAADAFGNTTTGYAGTVSFTSSDGQSTLPPSYTYLAADQGVHTFSATLKTAGSQSLTATDTSNFTGSQTGITVNAAATSKLLVAGFPSPATAGVAGNFVVTASDAFGNTTTGYAGTVSFTSSDSQSTLPPSYTYLAADQGVHTFSATLKTAGSQSITATDTSNFTGSQTGITVNAAAATALTLTGFPAAATAGTAGNFLVTAKDAFGNVATSYGGLVSFTSSDAQAVLPAGYSFTPGDAGMHTFSATLKTAGSQSITATDSAAGLSASQTGIAISAAAMSQFLVTGFPSPATAGVAGTFVVTTADAFGNRTLGYTGRVTFSSSDPQAILPGPYTFTAGDQGAHTFPATLKTAGTQTLAVKDTVLGSLAGSGSVTVAAAAASHFTVALPASVVAGYPATATVTALDPFNNVATGYRGTTQLVSSDSQAGVPVSYTFLATDNGIRAITATFHELGTQSLTATDSINPSVTGSGQTVVNDPFALLVVQAYESLLGRAPETAGLAFWSGRLHAGASRSEIATALTHTDEYYTTIVTPAYQQFLGRAPEQSGLDYWVSQMRAGLSDEQLQAGFIGSPEFYAKAGGTDKLWVDALYLKLLGRGADSEGETFWTFRLAQGDSRASVAFGFSASPEEEAIRVQGDYQHYLLRQASAAEVHFWVNLFTKGVTNENIVAGFVGSDEYFLRALGF